MLVLQQVTVYCLQRVRPSRYTRYALPAGTPLSLMLLLMLAMQRICIPWGSMVLMWLHALLALLLVPMVGVSQCCQEELRLRRRRLRSRL